MNFWKLDEKKGNAFLWIGWVRWEIVEGSGKQRIFIKLLYWTMEFCITVFLQICWTNPRHKPLMIFKISIQCNLWWFLCQGFVQQIWRKTVILTVWKVLENVSPFGQLWSRFWRGFCLKIYNEVFWGS
jgi:hypothetical protein